MNRSGKKKIKIVVPTNDKFVHEVFKNVAKNIYNDPYLFSIKRYNGNVTNNIRDVFEVIDVTVRDTIRGLLPFQNIIESYVSQQEDDDDDEDDEEEDVVEEKSFVEPTHDENNNIYDNHEEEEEEDNAYDSSPKEDEETNKDTMMENFFGSNEDDTLRNIPIGKSDESVTKSIPKSPPPRFFDDEDTPDPKA
jgi:hypothetical protein